MSPFKSKKYLTKKMAPNNSQEPFFIKTYKNFKALFYLKPRCRHLYTVLLLFGGNK
jgi:hypothetical protein